MLKTLTVLTICLGFVASREPEVEIADLFGDVLFQQGIPQSITCSVFDPLPLGIFTWKVGDKVIENSNRITEGEDGEKLQILQFTPTLEDNEKMLTCEYGERGEQVFSDHITMGIYVMDLPSDTITPGLVAEGDPIRLEVTAGLYPAPEPEDILWEVKNPDGEVVVEMSPGGQDEYGIYKAGEIEELSENLYRFHLDIAVLDKTEVSNVHTVTITTKGIKKMINFSLALKMKQEGGIEGNVGDVNINPASGEGNKEVKEEEPEAGALGMGMGLFIIIGIITVFIICCIIYCIYRRKKKTRSKNSKTYTAVKTTTNTHGQPV